MRPFVLDPLFRALTTLPGVGPKTFKLYEKLTGGGKVLNLLFHKPIDLIERIEAENIMAAPDGQTVKLTVTVEQHTPAPRRGQPYRIRCSDASGFIDLVFFNAHSSWIEKQFPVQGTVIIGGKVENFRDRKQIVHPDLLGQSEDEIEKFEVIYPLTAGLTTKPLRKAVLTGLETLPALPEWLDPAYQRKMQWDSWGSCLAKLHHPKGGLDLEPSAAARARLAYDELLSNQLTLALVRHRQRKLSGRIFKTKGPLRRKLEDILPFALTGAQTSVIKEIDADMASPRRMLRLLQGDVGSGKTIVAAIAMMNAIDSGTQAAIMAPTEILARQHAETLTPFFTKLGITVVTLTGRDKGKIRTALVEQIESGAAQIVIGTHSLFQETVEFKDLGLAIIDEQHRFGVHQRLMLSSKGRGTDVMVMTATPIPRTLALTAYGDMDVSRITEKPPGRKPVDTRLIRRTALKT